MYTLLLLIGILCVMSFFAVMAAKTRRSQTITVRNGERVPQYKKRYSVMNKSEAAFFFELEKQLPAGYHIFPKMRIADLMDAVDGRGFYFRRNQILPKHVDFVVCDDKFRPMVAIEVNGDSHQRPDRIARDDLVKEIFADAQIPLEMVNVGASFEERTKRIFASMGVRQPVVLTDVEK